MIYVDCNLPLFLFQHGFALIHPLVEHLDILADILDKFGKIRGCDGLQKHKSLNHPSILQIYNEDEHVNKKPLLYHPL